MTLPEGNELEDAQALAAQFPDTFGAPSPAEIANLKVGYLAKIDLNGDLRFWTNVEGIDKFGLEDPMEWRIIATTLNINPIPGLPPGSRIMFRGKNIYEIASRAEMAARAANPLNMMMPMRFSTA
ncbi:MAG: hypothetical protein SGARI_005278, partial [Bacillariaceae sp.]